MKHQKTKLVDIGGIKYRSCRMFTLGKTKRLVRRIERRRAKVEEHELTIEAPDHPCPVCGEHMTRVLMCEPDGSKSLLEEWCWCGYRKVVDARY